MKCKQGDTDVIIYSLRQENIGRIVRVAEYIGKFEQGDDFEFRGMPCRALVHDHYWWIEAEDLSIGFGPSPRAYIADSWLEPIRPKEKDASEEAKELDIFGLGVL